MDSLVTVILTGIFSVFGAWVGAKKTGDAQAKVMGKQIEMERIKLEDERRREYDSQKKAVIDYCFEILEFYSRTSINARKSQSLDLVAFRKLEKPVRRDVLHLKTIMTLNGHQSEDLDDLYNNINAISNHIVNWYNLQCEPDNREKIKCENGRIEELSIKIQGDINRFINTFPEYYTCG